MAIQRNKEEILQRYTAILGKDFARVFYAVSSDWTAAWVRHDELFKLFGDRENIEILNMVEPRFFGDVQQLFYNDLILHVARLTDQSRRSLSVQSLERYLKDDPDLQKRVRDTDKRRSELQSQFVIEETEVLPIMTRHL